MAPDVGFSIGPTRTLDPEPPVSGFPEADRRSAPAASCFAATKQPFVASGSRQEAAARAHPCDDPFYYATNIDRVPSAASIRLEQLARPIALRLNAIGLDEVHRDAVVLVAVEFIQIAPWVDQVEGPTHVEVDDVA